VTAPRRDSKWWGWGDPEISPELDSGAVATLRERVGELAAPAPVGELGEFDLPQPESLPAALREAAGDDAIFTSTEDRVRHATGCGYPDLTRLRSGRLAAAPDAVVMPSDADAVRRVLAACAEEGVSPSEVGQASSEASSRCAGLTSG